MYIGEIAKLTGATPKAIRLYENLGLIPVPNRKGKYRVYTENDVGMVRLIKDAQRLGFKLSDLKELLDEEVTCQDFPWDKAALLIQKKIETNREEIKRLQALNTGLHDFLNVITKERCSD